MINRLKKNTTQASAIKANIDNNELNLNGKDLMIKSLNKCKFFQYLFIESVATIIDLEYENRQ